MYFIIYLLIYAMRVFYAVSGHSSLYDIPDYDLFFTTLAKDFTAYYSEDGIDAALEDSHLPGNIRVNCILSQFDEFYETYDIDENSPFYVPEDKRLTVF